MTAIFTCQDSQSGKLLIEKATMEKPPSSNLRWQYDYELQDYERHLASLRRYPVHPDYLDSFTIGDDYAASSFFTQRGKQIKQVHFDEQQWQQMAPSEKDEYFELVALPVASKQVEDKEVWEEVIKDLLDIKEAFQWTWDDNGKPHTSDSFNIPANGIHRIELLIEKLILTKK